MQESLLRRNACIVDELDVTLSFANLAAEMGFVRPTLTDEYVTPNQTCPMQTL